MTRTDTIRFALNDRVAWVGDVRPDEEGCPIGHVRYIARHVEVPDNLSPGIPYTADIAVLIELELDYARASGSISDRFSWFDVRDTYLVRIDEKKQVIG